MSWVRAVEVTAIQARGVFHIKKQFSKTALAQGAAWALTEHSTPVSLRRPQAAMR
jgi:hypothetical protein